MFIILSGCSADPIRRSNTTIVFDRVDHNLLPHDYQPAVHVATWTPNATYPRNSYVVYDNKYYKANIDIAGTTNFSSTNWTDLGPKVLYSGSNSKLAGNLVIPVPIGETSNTAIARNIVTLTAQSNTEVQSGDSGVLRNL